jgi:NAD(P)-dependent dehydrogenase (short-subunit alcohol dehydrogenase family)
MTSKQLQFPDLKGRVALISGSSRGIGRQCALSFAKCGCNIVVTGKSTEESANLPGSIYSVAKEIESLGVKALPVQLDLRDEKSIEKCVEETVKHFGRIDIVVNNASALWWHTMEGTPLSKYDLITSINCRGAFYLTKLCFPVMRKNNFGRVICMSPPIQTAPEHYKGYTAYNISKFGMTMVAMGAAAEGTEFNITGNSLWPATVIESQASINFDLGNRSLWRKSTILADAALMIIGDASVNGRQLIDDEFLATKGQKDFKIYRYDPNVEPPRLLVETKGSMLSRGDVREVNKDKARSKL